MSLVAQKRAWGHPEYIDSAGHVRSEFDIREIAYKTLSQMSTGEVLDMLMGEWFSPDAIPQEIVRCPCHDWWYDECKDYR